jgi:hypothetical protein
VLSGRGGEVVQPDLAIDTIANVDGH